MCKAPEVAPNSVCKILVVGGGNNANSNNTVVSDNVSQIPQVGTSVTSEAMATDDNSQAVSGKINILFATFRFKCLPRRGLCGICDSRNYSFP